MSRLSLALSAVALLLTATPAAQAAPASGVTELAKAAELQLASGVQQTHWWRHHRRHHHHWRHHRHHHHSHHHHRHHRHW